MEVFIACGAMPFSPTTLTYKSLGGSETAALMLGKALAAKGHKVVMCCNLPQQDQPDYWPSGVVHDDKVRYVDLQHFEHLAVTHRHDLLIAVRDPQLVALPTMSAKKVLWMHDIATKRGMQRAFDQIDFTFDEVWAVSEWHRQQIVATTGYPLANIVALRNGIVPVQTDKMFPRSDRTILYAARPERGLDNLIRPGGIMEHLPEFKLRVAMYDHFPEHMRDYYNMIFARMKAMPNVEFIGSKPQAELRQIISEAAAYIYPTQFEETSCILARECIEQQTPFFTTRVGALPETLGSCGIYFEDWLAGRDITPGTDEWCAAFAGFFREGIHDQHLLNMVKVSAYERTDLYWDGVADMVEENARPEPVTNFSRIWSLIQDGDVIAAKALLDLNPGTFSGDLDREMTNSLLDELKGGYPFLFNSNFDMAKFYDDAYTSKSGTGESELQFTTEANNLRFDVISEELAALPPGSRVLEYGCGPGHLLAPLAKRFPLLEFTGVEFAQSAVNVVEKGAAEHSLSNLRALCGDTDTIPGLHEYDAVILSEVLEHVIEPWKLLAAVEQYAKPGSRVLITVPFGSWEPIGYERSGHWNDRNHLWHIDKQMFKDMCGDKPNETFLALVCGMTQDMRGIGQLFYGYNADHAPIRNIDIVAKAMRHIPHQTCAAAVIAYNNEDTILKMLNSIEKKVQFVQIAHGPSTDNTRAVVERWFAERPWMRYRIIDVPKIEPWKFGFDDARNISAHELSVFDWVLWIDTDEYLSGDFRKYLRHNSLDGYLISQHHFTCVPRGNPVEIDRPARLFKANRGYIAHGHIHEHFEVAEGGPGRCYLLPDVDIGHSGYVNEDIRRERFFRNFPFLEWDHQTEGSGRKLHKFLWFRDILHRMRFSQEPNKKVALAKEAIEYYNENQADMGAFGPGLFLSIQYVAEAYELLGIGVPVKVAVQLEDKSATLNGRFESYEQLEKVLKQLFEPEFKDRANKYW